MFTTAETDRIRRMAEEETGITLPVIEAQTGPGLTISWHGGRALICAENRNALARGCFLLSNAVRNGQTSLEVSQTRHFASCGMMLDMSRNAVMTVDAVKHTLNKLALLGLNLLMLYTEDTYSVPDYPYLGYLRGRYSQDELRSLDDYAASLDIELMPCIQALGHMQQFLQWKDSSSLRDQSDILLPDEPATYRFIEAAVSSLRSCMRAKRIHVGMDEADGVGLGRYYELHGPTDRFALLNRHLGRVEEICRKYSFHPMMWSDMFFRLGSRTGDYYDPDAVIPQQVIDTLPDVDLVYWDYYHTDEAFYDHMLSEHSRMGKAVYAGGIWTWSGFLPQVKRTEATMKPALSSCARHGVDTVFATLWGDDGAETCYSLAYSQLPIFSEACWQGGDVPAAELAQYGELLTGLPAEAYRMFGQFYPSEKDQRVGKALIWCDPLYPVADYGFEAPALSAARYREAAAALERWQDRPDCCFALQCFRVAAAKGEIVSQVRQRYLCGDKTWLRDLAENVIPALIVQYDLLQDAHRALWTAENKRFGWEVMALRYGSVKGRLEDVRLELLDYLDGRLGTIEALDEEPLPAGRRYQQFYQTLTTPMVNSP